MSTLLEPLNIRFRHILAFSLAALITAAVLRHGFHVYGGLTRTEIAEDALLAIPVVVIALIISRLIVFRRKRGRP